jgi:hypothetical protein
VSGGADMHRDPCSDDHVGHNKGGRKTEGGRVAYLAPECQRVMAAAAALSAAHRVVEGYGVSASSSPGPADTRGVGRGMENVRLVSEYPAACVALSVPTAAGALPVESVLMNEDVLPLDQGYWMAPEGVKQASLHICLALRASVQQLELVVPLPHRTRAHTLDTASVEAQGESKEGDVREGGEGGYSSDAGFVVRMTVHDHLVHGGRAQEGEWVWDVSSELRGRPADAAAQWTVLTFSPHAPAAGRFLCLRMSVSKGRLCLGRLRVRGVSATSLFHPPPTLVGSSECVASTSLTSMLQVRHGLAAIRGVRANVVEGGCGGMMGACNGEGLSLELVVDQGTPITGVAIELRSPSHR